MGKSDILIQGRKLSVHQKSIVLGTFHQRPNGMTENTWLKTHSFWFTADGRNLSNSKHYPQRNDSLPKDESLQVVYALKNNSLFDLTIINNKTRNKYLDRKNLSVDDMREEIREKFPDYYGKIWSSIVMKFNSGKSDGYSIKGSFLYNSLGNETLKL